MSTSFGSAYAPLRVETISNGTTTRILIHGEADIANADHLDAFLTGLHLDGTETVLMDVSELTFFDVAALRRLVAFARGVRQSGRDVVTCGATPVLHNVTRLLEVHDELGLR